jgi:hypothetical protein
MVVCAAHEGVLAGLSLLRAAVLLLALSTSMAADAGSWTRLYLLAGQNLRRIRCPHLDEGELAIARPRIARSWLPLWLPNNTPNCRRCVGRDGSQGASCSARDGVNTISSQHVLAEFALDALASSRIGDPGVGSKC